MNIFTLVTDTYGGIEHMQSNDVAQCRRLITRPGCEQVHRYAFEMARQKGARRVTCAHKANIMKLTDGLFLESFYKVAKDYQDLKFDDIIIDDCAMKLVSRPDAFDVIVLPNLQGDIMSDLAAGLVGGLGMAPSANIGDNISIFEAVHGTAPDIAGKNLANPTALLLSGIMMLRHLGLNDKATHIEQALIWTLQRGYHTRDLAHKTEKGKSLGTAEFADAIIQNFPPDAKQVALAVKPFSHPPKPADNLLMKSRGRNLTAEKTVGVDVFMDTDLSPSELAKHLQQAIANQPVRLTMLSNRGTQVWPTGSVFTECINHYRARFEPKEKDAKDISFTSNQMLDIAKLLSRPAQSNGDKEKTGHVRVCSLEMLLKIGDKVGFSLAQGQ